jgi:tRNA1Val (adenine37-N6)-methyltransferase
MHDPDAAQGDILRVGRPVELAPDETLDRLTVRLHIIQRRRGHRAATDDVLLAWAAARACARPQTEPVRVLELGCGKGTVAMLLLACRPQVRVTGIEALAQSHALAVRNAAMNALADRFQPLLGDLIDPATLAGQPPFALALGAPPFMPIGSGVLPRDEERAAGRFELRGGVREYAVAAAAHLGPGGRVILLMDGRASSRVRTEDALTRVGFNPRRVLAVRPYPGAPPVYWLIEADRDANGMVEEALSLRSARGASFSPEYEVMRRELDLPLSR